MRMKLGPAACPSECVLEKIPGHLIEVLLLARHREIARHLLRKGNSLVRVDLAERVDEVVDARSDWCLGPRWPAQGRGPRPSEMMADAALHQYDQRMEVARRIAA